MFSRHKYLFVWRMDHYTETRRLAIENATLLWSIREIVQKPSEDDVVSDEERWSLPIHRELQLADDLAFIAANRDDSNQVMAVSI